MTRDQYLSDMIENIMAIAQDQATPDYQRKDLIEYKIIRFVSILESGELDQ